MNINPNKVFIKKPCVNKMKAFKIAAIIFVTGTLLYNVLGYIVKQDRITPPQGVLTGSDLSIKHGKTITCGNKAVGSSFAVDGVDYLVVDNHLIKKALNRASTLCTTQVTDMSGLFSANLSFNQNISRWDTSSVTDMSKMFYSAIAFNQPLFMWDTSNVVSMSKMFYNARSFDQNIEGWDTSSLKVSTEMLKGANRFSGSLNKWGFKKWFFESGHKIYKEESEKKKEKDL